MIDIFHGRHSDGSRDRSSDRRDRRGRRGRSRSVASRCRGDRRERRQRDRSRRRMAPLENHPERAQNGQTVHLNLRYRRCFPWWACGSNVIVYDSSLSGRWFSWSLTCAKIRFKPGQPGSSQMLPTLHNRRDPWASFYASLPEKQKTAPG